jgi:PIN domain nuclease of toxin-antitoxin system
MRVLLDTHALLWFLLDDPQLSLAARLLIENPATEVDVSPASYWEIAIKIGKEKYTLPEPYEVFMVRELADNEFRILPVEIRHTALLTTLASHHRDPFDRLLIAQSLVEGIPIVSVDEAFDPYGVTRLW